MSDKEDIEIVPIDTYLIEKSEEFLDQVSPLLMTSINDLQKDLENLIYVLKKAQDHMEQTSPDTADRP